MADHDQVLAEFQVILLFFIIQRFMNFFKFSEPFDEVISLITNMGDVL